MNQKRIVVVLIITFMLNYCFGIKPQSTTESRYKFEVAIKDSNLVKSKIQTNLKKLTSWNYFEEPEFNIDSLNGLIANELLEYLTERPYETDSNTINLSRIASPDRVVNIYNYSYSSGGTAGNIPTAILQWKKSNGKFGAKILEIPSFFYDSFVLSKIEDRSLYLFIGGWKGSSRLQCSCAKVIELTGDSLNLKYPAFYNQHSTLLYFDDIYSPESYCMACIDYSTETKEISIVNLSSDDRIGPEGKNSSVQDILKARTEMHYIFDGEKFKEK